MISSDGIETVSINPTSVLGKNDFKPSRLGKIVKGIHSGKLPFLVDGGLDVIDVEDLSKAIYNSINNGKNGHSYLISGKFRSFKEIHQIIEKYQENRQGYYETLKTFKTFGRGWTRRVNETTEAALKLI